MATNTAPNASSVLIGFVYLNQDSDGDGLNDGVEYPAAGVPVSDPMFNIVADTVFVNGFE